MTMKDKPILAFLFIIVLGLVAWDCFLTVRVAELRFDIRTLNTVNQTQDKYIWPAVTGVGPVSKEGK